MKCVLGWIEGGRDSPVIILQINYSVNYSGRDY